MFLNPVYKKVCLVVFLVFSIYAVVYLSRMHSNLVESFAERESTPENIKKYRNEAEDRLLITKYRKTYEDTIIELDDAISVAILSEVCQNAELLAEKPMDPKSADKIVKINQLKMLKDSLNDAMKTLDKK